MPSLLSSMLSKPGTWLLHIALTTILVGACVTHFFGEQGEIHLRADHAESLNLKRSALSLFLWDFQVVYDSDNNPVDYIADLRLLDRGRQPLKVDEGTLRMNKPLKYHNWRFCQSNFDSDQLGVTLRYNYDPWGIGITYTGYALLLIAMIAFFFQPRTRFRALLKSLTAKRSNNAVVLQRSGLTALAVIAIILAIIMTKVVTPKPPLQPVLQTPLLGIHVSVIMLAYTLFAIIAINGILGLCMPKRREQLMHLSQILLYPAEFCLMAGIFIGAVWANMSWGRYWGWDPKETWALITMLVYALLLHLPWLAGKLKIKNEKLRITYHIFSIVAFAFVLFTYFGVTYLLGGLHSYMN
jgi:ABC-type transport system involved in cytochrome c biogenesis permease subunit